MIAGYGALLDAVRGLRWSAPHRVGAALPGVHRSTQRGTAGEFTEYRLYRPGDDPRALDWKLLARSDRPFVRLTEDRALWSTWFLIDASASMAFPPDARGEITKWDVVRQLTVGLASVVHQAADPIGLLMAHGDGTVRMLPRTRRGTVAEIGRLLDGARCSGTASLAPLIAELPARARLIIVTDGLGDEVALRTQLRPLLVQGASVHYIHVVAEAELNPPAGIHRARDLETQQLHGVLGASERAAYLRAFAAFRAELASAWRALGAHYAMVSTASDLPRSIRALVTGASDHLATDAGSADGPQG